MYLVQDSSIYLYLYKIQMDKYWYFENAQLSATGEGSGTARADGSKYSITLLSEAEHLSYEILSTEITGNVGDFPLPTQS
jgi:hypothetical protein